MKKNISFLLVLVIFLAGCSSGQQIQIAAALTPYGSTLVPTQLMITAEATGTPLPTPSPTPQYHTIQARETMSSIALLYGLDMGDVVQANPDINPNAMVVGMELLIPPKTEGTAAATVSAETAPIQLGEPNCIKEKSGGLRCFLTAENTNEYAVENVLVEITLGDESGSQLTAEIAAAPLNLIPSQGQLPLSAYFPPPIPQPYRSSYILISAIPVEDESRYINTEILDQNIAISEDGLTAQVYARVFVNGIVGETVRVWLSAAALDAEGALVGVRRIEAAGILDEIGVIEVRGFVYSAETAIDTVLLNVEAGYEQ